MVLEEDFDRLKNSCSDKTETLEADKTCQDENGAGRTHPRLILQACFFRSRVSHEPILTGPIRTD